MDTKANKWITPSDTLLQTVKDAVEAHLALLAATEALNAKNRELEAALAEVKTLQGLLPICSSCKKSGMTRGIGSRLKTISASAPTCSFPTEYVRNVQKNSIPALISPDKTGVHHTFQKAPISSDR
nr:hypothetical protein [Desulfobacula sp.]